ncbi:hypothetical protein K437DRAFT_231594 [Tilletiaria anomala UBC 951]|uniref:Prenyltransferase alpha-alpha toroid domain-containing protein n=1 Tax=Tilletiaria anomala (strain ATCC 24038 / CBS 436.72 / UBC 951) TaxID=1037660 RepID=A0A066WPA7_TILAU|nr:uncharacterized protein K437DRAFT_231594 [Tilletiaria anomala UBC 951]KDN52829.1 hypothetical protein K437DRAFT_231594 [Tilletiaria anomala UBC 951]
MEMDQAKHVSFWLRHLRMLPTPYQSADTQRMTIGYFCLSALDVLSAVESHLLKTEREELADWVYEQQIPPAMGGGFRGSPTAGTVPSTSQHAFTTGAMGHLAMTYTALLTLAILRDDFGRLNIEGLHALLAISQQADGSFTAGPSQVECDVRFTFCAFAIAQMAGCWDAVDIDQALRFLARCRNYDGGFSQAPMQESHGGSSYCAIAAFKLADRIDFITELPSLRRWLISRQQVGTGFNGRSEKPVDTCYSFWCGASLAMVGADEMIDRSADIRWLLGNQSRIGGFAKVAGEAPDAMHSYMGTAALALHRYNPATSSADTGEAHAPSLQELLPELNLSRGSSQWIKMQLRKKHREMDPS